MTQAEVMQALQEMGSEQTKTILMRHGAREPFFGVKVGDLKKLVKRIKKDHQLALALYATGNSDAMYLAGLIADEQQISREQLQDWASAAYWYMITEYTVAWIAAESPYGWELGMEWIESDEEQLACAGWATLSSWLSIRPDEQLDLAAVETLLERAAAQVHTAPNRVRYNLNGFVIAVGSFVVSLSAKAQTLAGGYGKVHVTMGSTACKVPLAAAYIGKVRDMGRVGKRKKQARC